MMMATVHTVASTVTVVRSISLRLQSFYDLYDFIFR